MAGLPPGGGRQVWTGRGQSSCSRTSGTSGQSRRHHLSYARFCVPLGERQTRFHKEHRNPGPEQLHRVRSSRPCVHALPRRVCSLPWGRRSERAQQIPPPVVPTATGPFVLHGPLVCVCHPRSNQPAFAVGPGVLCVVSGQPSARGPDRKYGPAVHARPHHPPTRSFSEETFLSLTKSGLQSRLRWMCFSGVKSKNASP